MQNDDIAQERRALARKKVRIFFLIKVGNVFKARGVIMDINSQGMRLVCPHLFKPRLTIQDKDYIGESIKITLPSHRISIDGRLAWVDLRKGEGAIRVFGTSDESRWREIHQKGS